QTLTINPNNTFTNNGTLIASAGTLTISATNWSSTGAFQVGGSGLLNLGGSFSDTRFTTFTRTGGTVNITGTLDNTGNPLNIGNAGVFGMGGRNSLTGTIRAGTLTSDATALTSNSGTLDGVTIGSNLALGGTLVSVSNNLALANGITLSAGSTQMNFNGP